MKIVNSLLLVLYALVPLSSWAQKIPVKKIALVWQVVENASKERRDARSVFTLINNSSRPLAPEGWSLYFNSPRYIQFEKGNLIVEHMHGDLYRVTPTKDFTPISKGEAVRGEWTVDGSIVNLSDAPKGFYWVWDDKPDVGLGMEDVSIVPPSHFADAKPMSDKEAFISHSERIFRQNETIDDISEKAIVKVFPKPFAYKEGSGLFMITESTWIETDPAFEDVGHYLAEELYFLTGKMPALNPGSGDERNRISIRKSKTKPEAYTLSVSPTRIEITASTSSGVFYAIQSMKTLMLPSALKSIQRFIAIPSVEVMDGPRFGHRALLLDVARNFHSKRQVMKVIDLMALYKLNVLHLHLSDDEGWRLEIPGLPELTEIGGRRGHNLDGNRFLSPAYGSGPGWEGNSGNGYYTRQEFIDILQYAKLNFVTIIPEIETPGHARAAIVSMNNRYHRLMSEGREAEAGEYLLTDHDQSLSSTRQGWGDNVMDPGLPSTYRFIEKVVDEIIAIYSDAKVPLSLIHIGGNDFPADAWTESPIAMSVLKGDPDIRDNQDLRRYFFRRIHRILKAKGLPLYGWQDIAIRQRHQKTGQSFFPDPEFAHCDVFVDVHKSVSERGQNDLAIRMANAGYKVVMTPPLEFGFHLPYETIFDEPGYCEGFALDTDKPFQFQLHGGTYADVVRHGEPPARKEALTEYGRKNVIGIKGVLWSQMLTSPDELEYMLLPRLLALAERAWSRDPIWDGAIDSRRRIMQYREDWSHFVNVLGKRELIRLDYYHGGYQYRIPAPGLMVDRGELKANIQFPGLTLRYTTDGREPSVKSPQYTEPIPAEGIIKVRAFNAVGRGGRTSTWTSPLPLPEYGPEDQNKDDSAYTHK